VARLAVFNGVARTGLTENVTLRKDLKVKESARKLSHSKCESLLRQAGVLVGKSTNVAGAE
jgi:hypothetical protein